jgi:hypothetical protein
VTSLFFERLRLSIPLLTANYLAKSQKPESAKMFLLISRTLIELFSSKKPARADIPALLILLKLRQSSETVLLILSASTNSGIPPSLIRF